MVTEEDDATVCDTIRNRSLQRDILVIVRTVSGVTSTGEMLFTGYKLMRM